MRLYTIGHGNLDPEPFIEILRSNDVGWVADVRSAPYSRKFPWFSKNELSQALEESGIGYVLLGTKLGGKPREDEAALSWSQGRLNPELVSTLSRTERWTEGIQYLARMVRERDEGGETGCLLCSERDPNNCHRSLISFNLESALAGLQIVHLGHDSTVREAKFQNPLFAMADERDDHH